MRGNKSFQKRIGSSVLVAGMVAAMIGASLAGCSVGHKSPLDPNHPVSLTVWHYYHGAQQNAFDALVEKFNSTVGKEEGIYVQGISQGSVSDLESAVSDSLEGKVGAADMPDIFSSYADTAYEVEQKGALANLSDYLTDEELLAYVDSYVEEGRIAEDNSLRIFPVAKSTEIMMLNKTDWDTFAAATGVTLDELATIEGVVEVSQKYYEWTDSLTPDVPEDGKAFYGRDAMANYFCIGMKQLGNEIFQVDGGEVTLNVDQDSIRRLWDGYYVPMVKGYFCAYGTFRSDDMKTGDLLAYTGSTASATYFPDEVENEEERYAIDYLILQAPKFQGGENYAVQQGAGMVVSKSDEQHEYAAVEFLKWFTQVENNYMFCEDSGYLPVRKDASSTKVLDRMIQEEKIAVSDKSYDCLTLVFDEMQDVTMYTNKSFRNGEKARQVLEYRMSDQALADRAEVENRLSQGMTLEEAAAPYLTETYFEQWYQSFCEALQEAVNQS